MRQTFNWCDPAYRNDDPSAVLVCIDGATGCLVDIQNASSAAHKWVIPPNRSIVVIVRTVPDDQVNGVSVALDGTPNDAIPTIFVSPPVGKVATDDFWHSVDDQLGRILVASPASYYIARFVPRAHGLVPLTVSISRDTSHTPKPPADAPKPRAGKTDPYPVDIDDVPDSDANEASNPKDERKPRDEAADAKPQKPRPSESKPAEAKPSTSLTASLRCFFSDCQVAQAIPAATPPPDPKPKATKYAYELWVAQVYGGAFRLGLGAVVAPGLRHSYGLRKAVGSDVSQIVDNGGDPVAAELVVGYAAFISDHWNPGQGRSYGAGGSNNRVGLYFGFGALAASPTAKVDYLRSIHLGVEIELTPGTSIAVTAVLRRIDALAKGYELEMQVPDGTTVTRTSYELGGGVILNFTPAFFQFAAGALPH